MHVVGTSSITEGGFKCELLRSRSKAVTMLSDKIHVSKKNAQFRTQVGQG